MVNSKEGREKRVLLELVQGKNGATGVRLIEENCRRGLAG